MADGNNVVRRRGSNVEKNSGTETVCSVDYVDSSSMLLTSSTSSSVTKVDAKLPDVDVNSQMYRRLELKVKREETVLWRQPLLTLNYFFHEVFILLKNNGLKLWKHKKAVLLCLCLVLIATALYFTQGPHRKYLEKFHKKIFWCTYWVGLGVLSSIGLGTGLHTFLLYLGPHIASVTLAAYECGSLEFPSPPYPDEIICPDKRAIVPKLITIWSIMSKVRLEAFMWGAGTALGELPPYFMARAARLSGYDPEEEDLMRFEQLINRQNQEQSSLDRAKLIIERLVERVGFFGILACASIPNPLFDLAGITCGHFLVPFWTFFGATLIGKAIVKMHIQKMFVIIAFNEDMLAKAVGGISYVPYVGQFLQAPFKEFLVKQKAKLHRIAGTAAASEGSWLSWIFEKFVIAMVIYFILSVVNSLAQSYHKRLHKQVQQERK